MINPVTSNNKFSIILPVKNGGEYVKECVSNILGQTFTAFDLIILENGSTDGTVDYLLSLEDKRVIVYPAPETLSMEMNWARIVTVPRNKYMTIIGHDDIFHADYLEKMNLLIQKFPDATLYQTHFNYIDANGKVLRSCKPMKEMQTAAEFIECQMTQTMDSMGTGYMMRSTDYDDVGGIPTRYPNLIFADYELWVRLTAKGYLATTSVECFSYRLHENISKKTNGEAYVQAFDLYMLFLKEMKDADTANARVIEKHGKEMLLYFCQSLSHRLLKTKSDIRKTSVGRFIDECRGYADLLIPGQRFNPYAKPKILAAFLLDNAIGLKLFSLYKKSQYK